MLGAIRPQLVTDGVIAVAFWPPPCENVSRLGQEVFVTTHEDAERVQLALEKELSIHDPLVGSGLRANRDGWAVVLYLQNEAAKEFAPKERDGVPVIVEVLGVIELEDGAENLVL